MQKKDTKLKKEIKYDVAVVGGGPAGIMVAATAAELGAKVVLIEKNKQLGNKLLLTGKGRCNLTNAEFNLRELVKSYNNGEFLFHAFSVFGPKETIEFFEKLGVKTKIENGKRVFPASNDAEEVLEALNKFLVKNKVEVLFNCEVKDVVKKGNRIGKIILNTGEVTAKKYIFCSGGKSYSLTGSDGSGYKLVEKLGHTIINPKPALTPIKLKDNLKGGGIKNLQGINLENIRLSVFQNNKKQFSEPGEILFTHFGISGPAVLNISGKVGDLLELGEVKIIVDLFPELNQEEVSESFEEMLKKYPKKTSKNVLSEFLQERLAEFILGISGIDKDKTANNMSKIEKAMLVKILKNFELTPEAVLGFEGAMVTRGGVSLKEIDHKTMQSKIIDNLFFAGEIIDVDGRTGGFNLQSCWSTGYLAGKSVID
ncbi:MAG: NAD(P)/FAD-dependent oxidoreductase [Candidatus Staskawiczbacteria bacterium]|nr:NAD(P)/FAD-dependent oxidoreductase [Candidatus Staskawiczbacteria bacterium]